MVKWGNQWKSKAYAFYGCLCGQLSWVQYCVQDKSSHRQYKTQVISKLFSSTLTAVEKIHIFKTECTDSFLWNNVGLIGTADRSRVLDHGHLGAMTLELLCDLGLNHQTYGWSRIAALIKGKWFYWAWTWAGARDANKLHEQVSHTSMLPTSALLPPILQPISTALWGFLYIR